MSRSDEGGVPDGYSPVNVEFTEEESEAIASAMDQYSAILAAQHPQPEEDGSWVVPVKVKDAMVAKALADYVEDLMMDLSTCQTETQAVLLIEKATQAQAKVYAIHNLPIYLFQLAGMFELAGDPENAKEFFRLFLRAQEEFTPHAIDSMFLNQSGFDMPKIIALAKEKLR